MKIKGVRVCVVIVAALITLAILLAIQFINQKYNVEQPLFKLYSETNLVNNVKIENQKESLEVVLDVKKTDNLQKAYKELFDRTQEVMGNTEFKLVLKDHRNEELENIFYDSQFIIYEAIENGNFSKMAYQIQANALEAGADAKVFIDSAHIYVELIQGENYLYEVIERKEKPYLNAVEMMGSGQV